MKKWESLGISNDKSIYVNDVNPKLEKLNSKDKIPSSLILIYLLDEYQMEDLDLIITQVWKWDPLGIFIAGNNSRRGFDRLLSILSSKNDNKHIMTGFFDKKSIEENLELFLISSWPSEDRFDEWENYNILMVGHETSAQAEKLKQKIRDLLAR